jgi:leucyl aminopeptidase (aminopeptidase T)
MSTDNLDPLYTKVAKKVLTESLQVRSGDSVTVEAWDNGHPFARRALAEARALGCTAVMLYEDERAYIEGVRRAPLDAVGKMGKNEYGLLAGTDAYIFVPGPVIGSYSRALKPEERTRSTRYNDSWYDAAQKAGLRGARLSYGYVGKDLARFLGKKVQDVARAQLRAALADFHKISATAGKISPKFADGAGGTLSTGSSNLSFSLKGELTVEDGLVDEQDKKTGNNMTYIPPGFVSKEVDPASASGMVTLTDTLTDYGVVSRAKLEFRDGKLVSWQSSDDPTVKKLIGSVPPAERRLKLLSVGLNPELGYGWGQDRFVEGSVSLGGFGFRGQVKKGTLNVEGSGIVSSGRLGV